MRSTYKAMCVSVKYSSFYTEKYGKEDLKGYSMQIILIQKDGETMRRTMTEIACYATKVVKNKEDGRINTIYLEDPIYADNEGNRPEHLAIRVNPGDRSFIFLKAKGTKAKIYKRTGKQKYTPGKNSIPVVKILDPRIIDTEVSDDVIKPSNQLERLDEVEVGNCV